MANFNCYHRDTPGGVFYAFPVGQDLDDWTTLRVELVEGTGANTGRYSGVLNDGTGYEWDVFAGASQPNNWNESIASFDLSNAKTVQNTNTIGGGVVTVVQAPVSQTGTLSVIIIGDDYNEENARAFVWTFPEIPDFSVGACQGRFGIENERDPSKKFLVTASTSDIVDNMDGTWTVTFEVDKNDTQLLPEGYYKWSVEIHQGGEEITISRNNPRERVQLVAKQTNEP